MTDAWLVVLNWNGRADTVEALDSLELADLPDTTVLVVDNASTDGSVDAIQRHHPWVRVLQTGANLGFAGGNNRGVKYALEHGAQVVGVLNNDTLVQPDFWPPLLELARNPATAACPDLRYAADPTLSWYFGAVVDQKLATTRHLEPKEQPPRSGLPETELLTGCCLVANADTWKTVGGFDERLFLIFEDADWSLRARRLGVHLVLQPRSVVRHKVSRSFEGQQQGLGLYYYCRNGTVFAERWLGYRAAGRFALQQALRPGLRSLRRQGGTRAMAVRGAALVAAAVGVRGPAGPFVTRLCNPGLQGRR